MDVYKQSWARDNIVDKQRQRAEFVGSLNILDCFKFSGTNYREKKYL